MVFCLAGDKAPGPDGYPISFYQHFWDLIKVDLCRFFKDLRSSRTELFRLKYTYITLIPKKQESKHVKDFRPISLIHGVVKIFSKLLAIRLSKHLDSLISDSQSTFIKGRQISDCYLSAMEIISFCIKSKPKGLVFQVDFEKACNRISWPFLLSLLDARGFGLKWCSWIKNILSTNKLSPIINGDPLN